jgi:hypothetical protein
MDRPAILMDMTIAFLMPSKMDYESATQSLNRAFERLMSANYFPLLEQVLTLRISVDRNTENIKQLLMDSLLLTSEYLRSGFLATRWEELNAYAASYPEMVVDFPSDAALTNFFPFSFEVGYEASKITFGQMAYLVVTFRSRTSTRFTISDLLVNFSRGATELSPVVKEMQDTIGALECGPRGGFGGG